MSTAPEIYKFFADYVFKHTGIEYKETDYYRLDSRINTLIRNYEVADADELYKTCKKEIDPAMHNLLIDLFTNNETYFMRDLKPFKALAKGIIPLIKERNRALPTLNMWCCASSTGQEIYSIKMAMDSFGSPEDAKKLKIDASDISADALKRAEEGIYTGLEVQRGLPAPFLIKYFEKLDSKDHWAVNKSLKENANFFYFNLLHDIYPVEKYDIIFCRNVLIYQTQENKRKIVNKLYSSLKPGGFLLFGAGESMIGMDSDFESIEVEKAWFYQKKAA